MAGFEGFARVAKELRRDVLAARDRDPAARGVSPAEILATWPGIHALLAYRVAHALQLAGVPFLPRLISMLTRALTGIEIHPAAEIGRGLFIDHGAGVVIGETAAIGDDVTLYQGVTLGGTGFATGKRHPTVQDNVTIGSGAKLLGPITIGHGAKIGANSVVITDVPPNATVVGNPGHPVRVDGRRVEGPDADWIHLPDPVAEAIQALVESDRHARTDARRAHRRRARADRRGQAAAHRQGPEPRRRLSRAERCRDARQLRSPCRYIRARDDRTQDHVGIVVDDLASATAFFVELVVIAIVLTQLGLIRDVLYTGPRTLDPVGALLSVLGMGVWFLGSSCGRRAASMWA